MQILLLLCYQTAININPFLLEPKKGYHSGFAATIYFFTEENNDNTDILGYILRPCFPPLAYIGNHLRKVTLVFDAT